MQTKFLPEVFCYDGTQLSSHWIYKTTGLLGSTIVSFIGPCAVKLAQMVDLEDVKRNAPIYSEQMLHFIVEDFSADLEKMILYQRLLIVNLKEEIEQDDWLGKIMRHGDDLFCNERKLSVSIATASPVSSLIHVGINVSSQNTPVPTLGLDDLKLNAPAIANGVMNRFAAERKQIQRARAKVRAVS